ncbi:MAG: YfbU family protein [Pseudomonadales bacterium]
MKMSSSEKFIALVLSDLCDAVGVDSWDTNLIRSSISTGNTWAISVEYEERLGSGKEEVPPSVEQVADYLSLWVLLEEAFVRFSDDEKALLSSKTGFSGGQLRFPGFDGKSESDQLSIATILIEGMGRFLRFKGRDLNSHAPLIPVYSRMQSCYVDISKGQLGYQLDVDGVASILKAAISGPRDE